MKTYRALGALLSYPSDDIMAALPEIRAALHDDAVLAPAHLTAIDGLI